MRSYYEKLVEDKGEEQAKAYMRLLRGRRKVYRGGSFNDPKVRAKALDTRKRNRVHPKEQLLQDEQT